MKLTIGEIIVFNDDKWFVDGVNILTNRVILRSINLASTVELSISQLMAIAKPFTLPPRPDGRPLAKVISLGEFRAKKKST